MKATPSPWYLFLFSRFLRASRHFTLTTFLFGTLFVTVVPPVLAADGSWTFQICGAPNTVFPGYVPHGDPLANGTATVTSQNSLLSVNIELGGNMRYYAHHAHLYSPTQGTYDGGNVEKGHSTICWAANNLTSNSNQTSPFHEKALSVTNWPHSGASSEAWYKSYIDRIPADGGDWALIVHLLGGHFALDSGGQLIPWDASKHEVQGDSDVSANHGGSNNVSTNCNARHGRRLNDRNVTTGTCLGNTNGSFDLVDEPFLDTNGNAWIDSSGNLTAAAIDRGYDLDTEYLFLAFNDEGVNTQWGGPEGGALGFLNINLNPNRCAAWPPTNWRNGDGQGNSVNGIGSFDWWLLGILGLMASGSAVRRRITAQVAPGKSSP